jgi:hypothetical protein
MEHGCVAEGYKVQLTVINDRLRSVRAVGKEI